MTVNKHWLSCVVLLGAALAGGCAGASKQSPGSARHAATGMDEPPCDAQGMELGTGTYRAFQLRDAVVILAEGDKPGAAYDVCLARSATMIYPPEYSLKWKNTGTGTDQQTPYNTSAWFPAAQTVKAVTVHDRDTRHTVAVEQVRDFATHPTVREVDAKSRKHIVIDLIAGGGCKIIPEGSYYPMIYTQVFGPASRAQCVKYVSEHCNRKSR